MTYKNKSKMIKNMIKNIILIKEKEGVYIFKIKLVGVEAKKSLNFFYDQVIGKIELIDFSYLVISEKINLFGYFGVRSLLGTDTGFLEYINILLHELYSCGIDYEINKINMLELETSLDQIFLLQPDFKYHRFCNFFSGFVYDEPLRLISYIDDEFAEFYSTKETKFSGLTAMYEPAIFKELLLTYLFDIYLFINELTVFKKNILKKDGSIFGNYKKISLNVTEWYNELKGELPMQLFKVCLAEFKYQKKEFKIKKKMLR